MRVVTYLDEAGTHRGSGFMMMAGYTACLGQWMSFDKLWSRCLERTGLTYSHVQEMWGRDGEYKGWTNADVDAFLLRAFKITDRNTLFGFAMRLNFPEFEGVYRAPVTEPKVSLDSSFGLCFRSCVSTVPDMARRFLDRDDLVFDFVVESGHENAGAAPHIFKQIKGKKIVGVSELLGTCTLGGKKGHYGLQAADALASSAYQFDDHVPRTDIPQDISIDAARKAAASCSPTFRSEVTTEVMSDLRNGMHDFHRMRREHWLARKAA